jgi:hypothetical protein
MLLAPGTPASGLRREVLVLSKPCFPPLPILLSCRFDSLLHPVVTFTTELAAQQAAAAQQALQACNTSATAAGRNNSSNSSNMLSNVSLLTGVPYGLKDLMSVPGYPTSWGLTQLRNRTINTVSPAAAGMCSLYLVQR